MVCEHIIFHSSPLCFCPSNKLPQQKPHPALIPQYAQNLIPLNKHKDLTGRCFSTQMKLKRCFKKFESTRRADSWSEVTLEERSTNPFRASDCDDSIINVSLSKPPVPLENLRSERRIINSCPLKFKVLRSSNPRQMLTWQPEVAHPQMDGPPIQQNHQQYLLNHGLVQEKPFTLLSVLLQE